MSGRWPPDRRHPAGADAMGMASVPDVAAAWLLTAAERGNPATTIGARFDPRRDGRLMREWATIPARHGQQWELLAGEALRFVGSAT